MTALRAAILWLAVGACSSSSSALKPGSDASRPDAPTTGPGGCPAELPTASSPCAQEQTSCLFGSICQGTSAYCTGGIWVENPVDRTHCPEVAPDDQSSCQCLFDKTVCTFNAGCLPDAGSSVTATCTSGSWVVTPLVCDVDAGDAGSPDAPDGGG